MTTMTMGSLFDGIGGFPLAAARLGIRTVWASEIEAFPMEVTRWRFPSMVHMGDITKLKGDLLFPVDIICGGSPCQDSAWPEHAPDWPASAPAFLWNRFGSLKKCGQRKKSGGESALKFVHALWCGKMFPGPLAVDSQRGRISGSYWKKLCESKTEEQLSPLHTSVPGRMQVA